MNVSMHEQCYMRNKCKQYDQCPMVVMNDIISGKWKLLILWYLSYGTVRFGDMQRRLPNVSQKVLSRQLKSLEEDKLILRHVFPEVPPRVEYELSDLGKRLIPLLVQMQNIGADILDEREEK